MSELKIVKEESFDKPTEGLKDGGHVYLSCSGCDAALVDIWITRPSEAEIWKLRAKCPFCKDMSFIHEVKGGFAFAGYAIPKESDEDNVEESTIVESPEIVDGVFEFNVKRATEHARAYRRRH